MQQMLSKPLRLIQWYDDTEELEDLYYLSIRLGIEKRQKKQTLLC